jgi:ADP-ribose pyrophosphatase YjhB (NUDIX family)
MIIEMDFCRRCGKPLKEIGNHEYVCSAGHAVHLNPIPGVGVFFVSQDNTQVLLSTRGIEPRKGMLDAFGGFLEIEESFEEAAARELHEELGLTADDYQPLTYLTSGHDIYPYKGEPLRYAAILFWTRLKTDMPLKARDDSASADWFMLADVPPKRLQGNDIRLGIRALQQLFNPKREV